MNKLLVICGPTATGKTALALEMATQVGGDLISADSRQVYKEMDIGTGKDIPKNFKQKTSNIKLNGKYVEYYADLKTKMWGLDLVNPDELFSVADFIRLGMNVCQQIWQENKIPILVGGTGLYIRALTSFLPHVLAPSNIKLHQELGNLSTEELKSRLASIAPEKFVQMNDSDQQNPRRLIRAIEVNLVDLPSFEIEAYKSFIEKLDVLSIGLTASTEEMRERINQRVEIRIKQGILEEIKQLLIAGYGWDLPAMSGLGYNIWHNYFEKKQTIKVTIKQWQHEEYAYAKRQMTWFKKEKNINWFSITKQDSKQSIGVIIKNWLKA